MSGPAKNDSDKFLLLPQEDSHDEALFANLESGCLRNLTRKMAPNNLLPAVRMFMGRAIDMHNIIQHALDVSSRHLLVHGEKGVGKSALVLMTAKYLHDRSVFKGGIFFVNVPKLAFKFNTLPQMLLYAIQRYVNYLF
ncbi:hypothetical protein RFI_01708 [Reticulomyxa filosa]|uniref:Uncharacterized protein n=1 Tax=Reticulomyxa filosa TaxID=46433 RepID=X6PB27_RETFI|nr:hypothetical protein RFI_01708 [Reticulomyxa filosa]|eukprot:ETO35351.1 hypothetical protein RFI_01708 [Reticulomyxa filosa]